MSHRERETVSDGGTSERKGALSFEMSCVCFGIRNKRLSAEERRVCDGLHSSRGQKGNEEQGERSRCSRLSQSCILVCASLVIRANHYAPVSHWSPKKMDSGERDGSEVRASDL